MHLHLNLQLLLLWTIPLLSSVGLVKAAFSSLDQLQTTTHTKYIVELESLGDLPGKRKRAPFEPHKALYESLSKRAIPFETFEEWDRGDLLVAVEMSVINALDLEELLSTPGVIAVRPVREFRLPETNFRDLNGIPNPYAPSSHIMSGVDKVHAQGFRGQGVNIAVIDSGIDYLHPTLGGGIGPQFLIKKGWDFVGDQYTGSNTPIPDPDPMDTCNGHGTHVAGIIAAQSTPSNPFNLTGVAPKANIFAYRVFGCNNIAQDPVIIDAMLRAYDDGSDILNLSFGNADGWTESTTGVLASRIAKKGRVVVAAAGNDGAHGAWYAAGPASGQDVIAVGSIENTAVPYNNATLNDGHAPITYASIWPLPIPGTRSIYATSTDVTVPDDACNPLPDNTPNLSQFVVVIRRGGCVLAQKLQNAAAKGGQYFLIYNNGLQFTTVDTGSFIAALIREDDGAYLVNAFANNQDVKITFPQTGSIAVTPTPSGGLVSEFSTFGPTFDMRMKPSVAAPGGNILSTIPRAFGGFALASGTSQAAPYVAGAAALILQAKGKRTSVSKGMRDLLQSTSQPVSSSRAENSPLHTVAQQGAGLVNVFNAVNSKIVLTSPGQLLLNDTAFNTKTHTITIENQSSRQVTLRFQHDPASTVDTIDPGMNLPYGFPFGPGPVPNGATAQVSFDRNNLWVWPGASVSVQVTIRAPTNVDPAKFPIYSGFISVSSSSGEVLRVPYLGVAAKLRDMKVFDRTDAFFGNVVLPAILHSGGVVQNGPRTYSFINGDIPLFLYRRATGTPAVYIDLVKSDFQMPTSATKMKKRGLFSWLWGIISPWLPNYGGGNDPNNTFAAVKTLGRLASFQYMHRHVFDGNVDIGYEVFSINGNFQNGTLFQNNKDYKVLVRALRITGNPKKQEDYESYLSPIIRVERPL